MRVFGMGAGALTYADSFSFTSVERSGCMNDEGKRGSAEMREDSAGERELSVDVCEDSVVSR